MKNQYLIFLLFSSLERHQNKLQVEMMMKKILAASLVLAFVLTGCNTIKGVGKDVSSAGNAVSDSAQKTQDKL